MERGTLLAEGEGQTERDQGKSTFSLVFGVCLCVKHTHGRGGPVHFFPKLLKLGRVTAREILGGV